MANHSHESKVSLKLLIDKTRKKVLFAEAGKDFVDFLFNLMLMPIGTVTRLLSKKSMVGSLGNLYGSIENLNEAYLQTKESKESLLKPKLPSSASEVPLLLPSHDAMKVSRNLYRCQNNYTQGYSYSICAQYVSEHPQTLCPSCRTVMNRLLTCVDPIGGGASATATSSEGGGFVKGLVNFMVTDDLVVTPMATLSSITSLINEFGVKGINKVEERVVHLGMDQGLMILKESLQSDTVLSKVFLEQPLSGIKTTASSSKKTKKRKTYY